jgi:hypothetical protein
MSATPKSKKFKKFLDEKTAAKRAKILAQIIGNQCSLSHSCTHHTQQLLIALAPVVVVVVVVGCAFYRINNTGSTPESEYKPFVMENHAIILAMLKERFNDFESTKGR